MAASEPLPLVWRCRVQTLEAGGLGLGMQATFRQRPARLTSFCSQVRFSGQPRRHSCLWFSMWEHGRGREREQQQQPSCLSAVSAKAVEFRFLFSKVPALLAAHRSGGGLSSPVLLHSLPFGLACIPSIWNIQKKISETYADTHKVGTVIHADWQQKGIPSDSII